MLHGAFNFTRSPTLANLEIEHAHGQICFFVLFRYTVVLSNSSPTPGAQIALNTCQKARNQKELYTVYTYLLSSFVLVWLAKSDSNISCPCPSTTTCLPLCPDHHSEADRNIGIGHSAQALFRCVLNLFGGWVCGFFGPVSKSDPRTSACKSHIHMVLINFV